MITPITVRPGEKDGYYQIIAGERRWRAARLAGLKEIPAMVLEAGEGEVMELALIENLQRQDLNPIEEAEGYDRLMQQFGLTQEEVASRVVKSRSAVANALRLLGCRRRCVPWLRTASCPAATRVPCWRSRTRTSAWRRPSRWSA